MKTSHIIALLGAAVLALSVTVAYLVGYERGSRNAPRDLPVDRAGVGVANSRTGRRVTPPAPGSRSAALHAATASTETQHSVSEASVEVIPQPAEGTRPGAAPSGSPAVLVGGGRVSGIRFNSVPGTNNLIRIQGTSTFHDWEVESRIIGGYLDLGPDLLTDPVRVQPGKVEAKVEVFVPVRSLVSMRDGKPYSQAMDEMVSDKLLVGEHKRITYTLTELVLQEAAGGDAPPAFDSKGQLRVAGVTREIAMPAEMRVDGPWLTFTAKVQLKLSDFGIEAAAPTDGGGLIEIGDDVTVSVQWTVRRGHQGGDRDPF